MRRLVALFAAVVATLASATLALGFSLPPALDGDVSLLRVHTGPAGDAFAAWTRHSEARSDSGLRAATRGADGSWAWADSADEPVDPARVVPTGAGAFASSSDLAGNSVAVWRFSGAIQVAGRPAGGAYGPAVTLAPESGQGPGEVAVGLGGGGHATALWTVETRTAAMPYDASRTVLAADRAPDGTWSAPYELAPPDGPRLTLTCAGCPDPDRRPAVAVDAWGNAVAAWVTSPPEPAVATIVWSARTAGGTWSEPVLLAGPAGLTVQLAMGPNGNAIASWIEGGWLHAARKAVGQPFGAPEHLGPITTLGPGITSLRPSVTLDAAGRALAVWVSGNRRVLAATQVVGRQWSDPVDLATLTKPTPPGPKGPTGPTGPQIADPLSEPALLQRVRISRETLRLPACALRKARRSCRAAGAALTFRLSTAGEVRVTVQRRGRGKVLRGLRTAAGAGAHRIVIGARPLPPGRYTVRVRVTADDRLPETASKQLVVRPS